MEAERLNGGRKESVTEKTDDFSSSLSFSESKEESGCAKFFFHKYRYIVLVLATLCISSVCSNMLAINTTIVCMAPNDTTRTYHYPTYYYTSTEKMLIHWSVSIASMISTFPMSWICTHYGAKMPFLWSGIVSALSTGFIPLAAQYGVIWVTVLRAIQGIAYACDFAVIGVLCARWAPLSENAKFLGVLTCFTPLSSFLTSFSAGFICESSLGWPWVHYTHAAVGLLIFFFWFVLYMDDPAQHPFVLNTELKLIHKSKSEAHKFHEPFVPYMAICKDKTVWMVWTNAFPDLFCSFFLYLYGPTFLKNALKLEIAESGVYLAIGSIVHVVFKLVCCYISDAYYCVSERGKMIIFNTIALFGPSIFFIVCTLLHDNHPIWTVICFAIIHALLGFNCGGFYKCGALVSRQYSEFVLAFTQLIKCAALFIAPLLVGIFISDETNTSQWNIIFYIIVGWLVFANVWFSFGATDEPCGFTEITSSNSKQYRLEKRRNKSSDIA